MIKIYLIYKEQIKTVKRQGMPFYKDAMSHGNMYVKFLVQFPKKGELKDNQIKELQKVEFLCFLKISNFFKFLKDFAWTQGRTCWQEGKCGVLGRL